MAHVRSACRAAAVSCALTAMMIATHASRAEAQRRASVFGRNDSARDTTFAFAKNGVVEIGITNGDVAVTGSARDEVRVHSSGDRNIRIDGTASRVVLRIMDGDDDSPVQLSVPYGVRVQIQSRSGDVSVRGTRGAVAVHSMSGDIVIDEVTGRLDVNTLSGNLEAHKVDGDVAMETTSGDIRLDDVRGAIQLTAISGDVQLHGITTKSLRAKTVSGDVTYSGVIDAAGRYDLSSSSGDVRLNVPRETSAQVSITTWSGSVDSDFPIVIEPGEHQIGVAKTKQFTFTIGTGSARITAASFSGDVTVRSSGRGAR